MISWLTKSALRANYPATDALPGVDETGIDAFIAQYRREAPGLLKVGFYLGIAAFHLTPLFTVFVPLPAFLLPAGLRDKHAYKLATHPVYVLRQTSFLVKMMAGLCWGQHPEVRRRLGQGALPADPGTFQESVE